VKPSPDNDRAARALTHAIAAQPDDFDHPGYARLEAYVDGLADDVDSEVIEAHIEWCATCAQDVADLRSIAGGAGVAGVVEWKDASGAVGVKAPQVGRVVRARIARRSFMMAGTARRAMVLIAARSSARKCPRSIPSCR